MITVINASAAAALLEQTPFIFKALSGILLEQRPEKSYGVVIEIDSSPCLLRAGFQWHAIQNRSESKSRIWKKNEGKHAKTLAKIQVTAIFLM